MNFGVRLPVTGPFASAKAIIDVAHTAERLGFAFLSAHDHVTRSLEDRYHFSVGTAEAAEDSPAANWLFDAFATLAFVAGATKSIRLLPIAMVLSWRQPVALAKEWSTLHELSGNRCTVCVCLGGILKDFEVMGIRFEERRNRYDENLRLIKAIFSPDRRTSFSGKYVSFDSAEFFPKPSNLPIWIAGQFGEVTLRRVAEFGEGWIPTGTQAQIARGLARLDSLLQEFGRKGKKIDVCHPAFICINRDNSAAHKIASKTITAFGRQESISREVPQFSEINFIGSPNIIAEKIQSYVDVGSTFCELKFIARDLEDMLTQMELFSTDVMHLFK